MHCGGPRPRAPAGVGSPHRSASSPPRLAWSNPSSRRSWRTASSGWDEPAGERAKSGHIRARSSFPTSWSQRGGNQLVTVERPEHLGEPIGGHGPRPGRGSRTGAAAPRTWSATGRPPWERRRSHPGSPRRSRSATAPGTPATGGPLRTLSRQRSTATVKPRSLSMAPTRSGRAERPGKACGLSARSSAEPNAGTDARASSIAVRGSWADAADVCCGAGRRVVARGRRARRATSLGLRRPAGDHRHQGVDGARIELRRRARSTMYPIAPSAPIPRRCGRSVAIATNASHTATTRLGSGIALPRSPSG